MNDLLTRYAGRVQQAVALVLGRLPRDAGDIDDAVQEVLLAAFQNFEQLHNWVRR